MIALTVINNNSIQPVSPGFVETCSQISKRIIRYSGMGRKCMGESEPDKLTQWLCGAETPFTAQPGYFDIQETWTTLVRLHGSHDCSPVRPTLGF